MKASTSCRLAFAVTMLCSLGARADFEYTGPVVARTSGITCRTSNAADNGTTIIRGSSGAESWNDWLTFYCPIIRRNASPYGVQGGGLLGETVVNMSVLDVYLYKPWSTITCRVFGTEPFTGSQTISAPLYTCASNPNGGCTSPGDGFNGAASLHFTDPLSGGQNMVNIGYKCDVPPRSYVLGSVAQFPTW